MAPVSVENVQYLSDKNNSNYKDNKVTWTNKDCCNRWLGSPSKKRKLKANQGVTEKQPIQGCVTGRRITMMGFLNIYFSCGKSARYLHMSKVIWNLPDRKSRRKNKKPFYKAPRWCEKYPYTWNIQKKKKILHKVIFASETFISTS